MPEFDYAGAAAPVRLFSADAVLWVAPSASVAEAARVMAAADVGLVVVGAHDEAVGVLSERDVVRAVADRLDLDRTGVGSVASPHLVRVEAGTAVHDVAERMLAEYVRHVLVDDDGGLVGVVSARDLLGAYATADEVELGGLEPGGTPIV
ncbi:MAG: CBS domain-containing protein [Acidimicrobiales bacterium]